LNAAYEAGKKEIAVCEQPPLLVSIIIVLTDRPAIICTRFYI